MSEAIASHATRAAEKLRNEGLVAQVLRVFFHTSLFNRTDPRHSAHATIELIPPTNVTHTIIKAALGAAHPLWKDGFKYKRAGVYLLELSKGPVQCSLFDSQQERLRDKRIMSMLDAVNTSMGSGTLHFAASGVRKRSLRGRGIRGRGWEMRQLRRSPRYTTRWDELPEVRCGATSQAKRRV
jgi:DNA polymerase V